MSDKDLLDRILVGILIVLAAALAAIICVGMFLGGYEHGQRDALENRWYWQRIVADDGSVKYLELDKPVRHQQPGNRRKGKT